MFSFLKKDKTEGAEKQSGDLPPLPDAPPPLGDVPPIRGSDSPNLPPASDVPKGLPDLPPMPDASPEPEMPAPNEHPLPERHPPEPSHDEPQGPPEQMFPSGPVPEETMPAQTEHSDVGLFPSKPLQPQSEKVDFAPESPQETPDVDGPSMFPDQFVQPMQRDAGRPPESKVDDFGPPPEPTALRHEVPDESVVDRPLFVRADLYSDTLTALDDAKLGLRESEETIVRSKEIRKDLDTEYQKWHDKLEDVQRKLVLIDQSLFE